jgi:peptidoglycan hydrolase CwlO-like protein
MMERPGIVDEAATVDETAVQRRIPFDVLGLPRLLGGMIADIRTIADGMAVLPKLLATLDGIQAKVDSLDDEVKRMHASVESMGGDVSELQGDISRLEPHLEDVSRVAHPLRRIGERARRRDGGS